MATTKAEQTLELKEFRHLLWKFHDLLDLEVNRGPQAYEEQQFLLKMISLIDQEVGQMGPRRHRASEMVEEFSAPILEADKIPTNLIRKARIYFGFDRRS